MIYRFIDFLLPSKHKRNKTVVHIYQQCDENIQKKVRVGARVRVCFCVHWGVWRNQRAFPEILLLLNPGELLRIL